MRTAREIAALLPELEKKIADELEDQDLDFKQWDIQSKKLAVKKVVDMAVCMANGGGGTVVFGVADKVRGRQQAILGVPAEIDTNVLMKTVYDSTDPKITPVFETLNVSEGTGRLLIMQVHPGMPPYTDTKGRGTVRIGKDCQPLTGTHRSKISVETGESDYTAQVVSPWKKELLSESALESLRKQAATERAPQDLLSLSDKELLDGLNLIRDGKLTRAALLLFGSGQALKRYVPGHNWTFLHLVSDTDYDVREDGVSALPLSLQRIEELLVPFNPLVTFKSGLFHFEYRTWPEIAIREALLNAFCHLDLRIPGPVMVKVYSDRLEISNNGGFIAGITPENILHHQPAARNPLLVEVLTRLRLVNRSNLGISRMYASLLMEGKEPPLIKEVGNSVVVCFYKRELQPAFRQFVAKESEQGRVLGVDELIVLRYLMQHPEAETSMLAGLCQRTEGELRERLATMEERGYLEHGGVGRGAYWSLQPKLFERLKPDGAAESRRRITWDAAKTRVLSVLMERESRGDEGLSNAEIRQITRFDRNQVHRLMKELRKENSTIELSGRGKYARYKIGSS